MPFRSSRLCFSSDCVMDLDAGYWRNWMNIRMRPEGDASRARCWGARIRLSFRSLETATEYGVPSIQAPIASMLSDRMLVSASDFSRLTVLGLLTALALSPAKAPAAESAATPRFESAPCPVPAEPIPALQTARCGYLVVPEHRSKPEGRTIRLAVAIVPAASGAPEPDPVVFMTGGPGAAAILDTPFLVDAGINRNRDLMIMAQRGSLFSDPDLNCPELDRFYARQVGLVYDEPSTGHEQAAAGKACRDRLAAEGIDLSRYNTTENAADFADLRHA